MGSGYKGGFLFCAVDFDRARLIDLTVQAMDLRHGNMYIDYDFEMNNLPESSELLAKPTLEGLAKVKTGKIDFGPEIYMFGPDPYYEPDESSALLDLYSTVELNVYEGAFRQHGSDSQYDPHAYMETFVARWQRWCELINPIFAYFTPYEHMTYYDFVGSSYVIPLREGNMRRLLDECEIHWLLYLNADLVERMQQEGIPLSLAPVVSKEQPLEIKQLSTGGYFYRMREQVYY
jgi:hypothetical protein